MRKHAQTTRVAMTITRDAQRLRLDVQDWGCGFEPGQVLAPAGLGERIGLRGMRVRVALLGGHWSVQSSPGNGTQVVADIPLPSDDERN